MSKRARRFFLIGFVVHGCLVTTIGVLAYTGKLPFMAWTRAPMDLLMHAVLIGMMGMWLDGSLGFRPLWPTAPPWMALGPAIIIAIAALEEMMQMFAPNRSSTISDFAADVVGVVVFSLLARILTRRRGTPHRDPMS